jgi:hypothetical protein
MGFVPQQKPNNARGDAMSQIVPDIVSCENQIHQFFLNQKIGSPLKRSNIDKENSDGDLQMLQWTAAGQGPRLMLIVHHTDAEREWAYDRQSSIGRLDQGLNEAKARGWTVVDMKNDWTQLFPSEKP